jgi:hypothetical protein
VETLLWSYRQVDCRMGFNGFGSLQTPGDLFEKLQHDLARVQRAPADSYAAFDFFVTAHHLLDWIYPGEVHREARVELEKATVLLQLAAHIANGSKHRVAEHKKHHSVTDVDVHHGAFEPTAFESTAFETETYLLVALEEPAASKYGSQIAVSDLAVKVVQWWKDRLSSHPSRAVSATGRKR